MDPASATAPFDQPFGSMPKLPSTPRSPAPSLKVMTYANKPGTFYGFRDGSHTRVASCGAHVRSTPDGQPIPRIRMSKKQRRRLKQVAKAAEDTQQELLQRAAGRGPELRQLFVDLLNQFEGEVGRDASESERSAIVDEAIRRLPDLPPVAASNTEPVDSPFNPHPNNLP